MSKIQEAFTKALVSNIDVDQEVTEDFQKIEFYLSEVKSLKSVDKDKTTFLANMPHKMRGAVTSLIGASHILLTQNVASLTKEQSDYLKDIKRSADYISKALDDTTGLSEFKSLYDVPTMAEIDLKEHIEKVLNFLEEDFSLKKNQSRILDKFKGYNLLYRLNYF